MIKIVSPAPFFAGRALFEPHAHLKAISSRCATLQIAAAKTYGLAELGGAQRLLVLIGLWPHPAGAEELFVVARPGDELAPFMHRLASATRLILRWRLQSGGTGKIVALVRSDNEAGHRLARLGGFKGAEPAGRFVKYELRTASGRCSSGGARKGKL